VDEGGACAAKITGLEILGVDGVITSNAITLTLPAGTDLSALTPMIEFIGAELEPRSGVAQDFTKPVTYTVTANDGTQSSYEVTVRRELSTSNEITQFEILGVPGVIENSSIQLTLPYGTNPRALQPTIAYTGVSISPGSSEPQDFSTPVDYTVTAANGTSRVYTVTVTIARSSAKNITAFALNVRGAGMVTIAPASVTATVPLGTDLTSLTPTITVSANATLSPASGVAQDFTGPVSYVVTAEDGSTKTYRVRVVLADCDAGACGDAGAATSGDPR
jgi:hypothetical protein